VTTGTTGASGSSFGASMSGRAAGQGGRGQNGMGYELNILNGELKLTRNGEVTSTENVDINLDGPWTQSISLDDTQQVVITKSANGIINSTITQKEIDEMDGGSRQCGQPWGSESVLPPKDNRFKCVGTMGYGPQGMDHPHGYRGPYLQAGL